MKSIYFNSLQIHANTGSSTYVVKTPIEGLEFPEVRLSRYDRVGEYGAIVPNSLYGGRQITLSGYALASTVTAYEAARRALEGALGIQKDSNNKVQHATLKFTTMDDLALQCEVQVRSFQMRVNNIIGGEWFLDLVSPDYQLYSQNLSSATLSRTVGGGAVLPWILPIIFSASTGGTVTANNAGTAETFPTVTITGPMTNPVISNLTLNRYIQLNLTINTGEQVVIDMKNKTITKGGQSVIQNKVAGSKFWWLNPGDNSLQLQSSSGGDEGTVQVSFRNAYLGV
jgi:hypothetical protein